MKIEVTREIIKGTSGVASDIHNCVVARSITMATGRRCFVGGSDSKTAHFTDSIEEFEIDDNARRFIMRYILLPRWLQWTGSFEISWNPPPKNWQYRLQETRQDTVSSASVACSKRFEAPEAILSRREEQNAKNDHTSLLLNQVA